MSPKVALFGLVACALGLTACRGGDPAYAPYTTEEHNTWLAAAAKDAQGEPLVGLFVVHPDGSGLRRIYATGRDPSWSPDGKRIAFQDRGGIWVLDVASRRSRRVAERGVNPAWSADGRRIAFARGNRVYVVNLDGSAIRPTETKWSAGSAQARSPDGKSVAYSEGLNSKEIFVRTDGGRPRRVTRSAVSSCGPSLCLGYTVDSNPVWSPDGRLIAFDRATDSSLP